MHESLGGPSSAATHPAYIIYSGTQWLANDIVAYIHSRDWNSLQQRHDVDDLAHHRRVMPSQQFATKLQHLPAIDSDKYIPI